MKMPLSSAQSKMFGKKKPSKTKGKGKSYGKGKKK